MGEAKRRAGLPPKIVYHHTSTLRTNLIWMSGVVELEGRSKGAFHPQLGEIQTDVRARRACTDFPPLAWFTSSIRIPRCLLDAKFMLGRQDGMEVETNIFEGVDKRALSNGVALNRVALGFLLERSSILPWRDHPGFSTPEGLELNQSARAAGDDPDHWYVSNVPIDVAASTEVWISRRIFEPNLEIQHEYLADVHRMVKLCRDNPGTYIPPSWLKPEEVDRLVATLAAEGVIIKR